RFIQLQFHTIKMLNIVDILNGKYLDKYIGYKIG
ncbi:methionyl-tRNA formyltransferase, partial [Francisella tularensis subsp. holarctica]|nr:methionyl-tRNA formyltransferase [Francisella tularensis subsp. holarctica]